MDPGPLGPIFLVDVDLVVIGAQGDLWKCEYTFKIHQYEDKAQSDWQEKFMMGWTEKLDTEQLRVSACRQHIDSWYL